MRATLIVNPNAGRTNGVTVADLTVGLSEAGYDAVHRATQSEEELDEVLADVEGLVVAAGGDGTVRAVATRLIGRGIPLAILPLGTANNIGQVLGIQGTPQEIVAGLRDPLRCHFDVGRVRFPWGVEYFLEAFGYGFYAEVLATYEPEEGKSILRGLGAINQTLQEYRTHSCRVLMDGEDISGDYILFEVLNTTAFGPRLKMAPDASPSDGLFDVIRICNDDRQTFFQYAMSLVREELAELPNVEMRRGRKLEIAWSGFLMHVDGEVHPRLEIEPGIDSLPEKIVATAVPVEGDVVCVEMVHNALEFWRPRPLEKLKNE